MTDVGGGIYSFELSAELDGKTMNVIFSNNGANQHPDLRSDPGTQMLLTTQGQWIPYTPAPVDPPSQTLDESEVPSEPSEPSDTTPTQTLTPEKRSSVGLVLAIVGSICLLGALTFFLLKSRKK